MAGATVGDWFDGLYGGRVKSNVPPARIVDCAAFGAIFGGRLRGKRRLDAQAILVMIVGHFVDSGKPSPSDLRNDFGGVFARSIGIRLERNIFAEIVFCGVFQAREQAIARHAVHVDALMEADFGGYDQMADAALGMSLVATTFLALSCFVDDVVRQRSIAGTVHKISYRAIEHSAIVAENSDRHHGGKTAGRPNCRWQTWKNP